MSLNAHIIIPARYLSTRLPGKLLYQVQGKTVLEHVYYQAQKANPLSITIATDSDEIWHVCKGFGADVVMTQVGHASGTDRVAEAARLLGLSDDARIVNVQGDEPRMPPSLVQQVSNMLADPDVDWATLYWPIKTMDDFLNPNIVKVVMDQNQRALYFSRSAIPFYRDNIEEQCPKSYRHIGLYAYRMASLQRWVQSPPCELETYESLEQLRALWLGMRIQMQQAHEVPGQDINTMEDLKRFEAFTS